MSLFRHIPDDQLVTLARLVQPVEFDHAQVIFREEEEGRDLYLVRSGTVHVTRKTPVGTQILTTLGFGALFGEVSYLDRLTRSATAFGVGSGRLFHLPAADLDAAMLEDRDLAVSLLWSFWQTLAEKVRAANAQMSELFDAPGEVAPAGRGGQPRRPRPPRREGQAGPAAASRGCRPRSSASSPPTPARNASRRTPSSSPRGSAATACTSWSTAGFASPAWSRAWARSALAILERGEVFGEMALIDEQPRSADARAHSDGAIVFSVSAGLLEEVLSMDPDAAVQFLGLLCRLLCRRLRAMNERLVAWRIMASHPSQSR